MRTDELIAVLARGEGPVARVHAARRLSPAMAGGLFVAAALSIGLLGPVPPNLFASVPLWTKLAYAAALAAAAAWLAAGLARPLSRSAPAAAAVLAVLAIMLLVGGLSLGFEAPAQRVSMLLGRTWDRCPWVILALSLPGLAAALATLRTMAPTRPRAAGFSAGLLAGALGAAGYALHCPEQSLAFVAAWYSLGILASGLLGALMGPIVLRW